MTKKDSATNNKARLDKIDREIIEYLLNDSRISFSSLAKRVGISRGIVAKRIEKLQQTKIIEKFTVQVSREYLWKQLPVFFNVIVDPKKLIKVAEKISTNDDIVVVYKMSGRSALHVHGFFEDIKEVNEFTQNHIIPLSGVKDISTEFLVQRFKSGPA